MGQVLETMCEYLDSDDWKYVRADENHVRLDYSGKSGLIRCYIRDSANDDYLSVTSDYPFNVPEERRNEVVTLTTMINYGLRLGNFEMDLDDGQLSFRTSMFLDGCSFGNKLMKKVLFMNLMTTDRYQSMIMRIVYSDRTAKDVMREENDKECSEKDGN